MSLIFGVIITALLYAVAYIKSESNIFQYKYEREMRNTDYWRNEALRLQRRENEYRNKRR